MGSNPPQLPPQSLDYSTGYPGMPARPRQAWIDWTMAVSCISGAVAVTVVLLMVVPKMEAVYRDFGTKLPEATILLILFSRFCRAGGIVLVWGVFAAWPFVAPVIDGTMVGDRRRRYFRLSRLLLTLFMLAFFGWIIFGLFQPYVTLIDSVSGARPK